MTCPNCGAPIDMRDLGQVLEHDTPLHIEQDQRRNFRLSGSTHFTEELDFLSEADKD
jgi:hypothetical protein